jgi:glutamine amidotransferase-like uncharacterized protein
MAKTTYYVLRPTGSDAESLNGLRTALERFADKHDAKVVVGSPEEAWAAYQTDGADPTRSVFAIPGGGAYQMLWDPGLQKIQAELTRAVSLGAAYLGICAGAYLAADRGRTNFDLMPLVAPMLGIAKGLTATGPALTKVAVGPNSPDFGFTTRVEGPLGGFDVQWYQGPWFEGARPEEVKATYSDGRPAAVLRGSVAVLGVHPELPVPSETSEDRRAREEAFESLLNAQLDAQRRR